MPGVRRPGGDAGSGRGARGGAHRRPLPSPARAGSRRRQGGVVRPRPHPGPAGRRRASACRSGGPADAATVRDALDRLGGGPGVPVAAVAADRDPLIGRDAELAGLRRGLAAARAGNAHVVAVGGEPGIGKMRIVDEAAAEAAAGGAAVVRGRAAEESRAWPTSPAASASRTRSCATRCTKTWHRRCGRGSTRGGGAAAGVAGSRRRGDRRRGVPACAAGCTRRAPGPRDRARPRPRAAFGRGGAGSGHGAVALLAPPMKGGPDLDGPPGPTSAATTRRCGWRRPARAASAGKPGSRASA